eukprot:1742605-Pyramimonas_sp.AAC.1
MDNTAMQTALASVAHLGEGRPAKVFGYIPDYKGNLNLSDDIKFHPRVHLALQYLVQNYFRVERGASVRLAKSALNAPSVKYATGSTLIHYDSDVNPAFHYYECVGTGLNISQTIGSTHSRLIQCLTSEAPSLGFHDDLVKYQHLDAPYERLDQPGDRPAPDTPGASSPSEGRLSTIYEE